jgi:hypothetical protein
MSKQTRDTGIAPLPQYVMPDSSEPPYHRIMVEVSKFDRCQIGTSYFYIRACQDRFDLCRIIHGGGSIFFHELVDCEEHGISEDEMEIAAREDAEFPELPGYFVISPHIEQKLRVLYSR